MKRLLIKIYGRVQGVGFRYYTFKKATLLNIKGYVKNMPDGSVFVDCEGDKENLNLFLEFLKKGPQFAYVEDIEVKEAEPQGYTFFEIKR